MDSAISCALQSITTQILDDINNVKQRFALISADGESFDINIWLQNPIIDRISNFKELSKIDSVSTFNALFTKVTELVANCATSKNLSETQIAELSIYRKLFESLTGSNFRVLNESSFNNFLINCSKLVCEFPKRKKLLENLISISNSIIDNGAQPTVTALASLTRFSDFFAAFSFFVRLHKASDLAFERVSMAINQMQADAKNEFFNDFLVSFPVLFSEGKFLQEQSYGKKTYDAFATIMSLKAAKDPENIKLPAMILSLCATAADTSSDSVKYVTKTCFDLKKWTKHSRDLSASGFVELLGSVVFRGESPLKRDILATKKSFDTIFTKKGSVDLPGFMIEQVIPKYFAYDLILSQGEQTEAQKYLIENLNVEANSYALCKAVYLVLDTYEGHLVDLNQELLLNNFNEMGKNLKFKKANSVTFATWFFEEFSSISALAILAKSPKVSNPFFEMLIDVLKSYYNIPDFSRLLYNFLNNLFTQEVLLPNCVYLTEIIVALDKIIQRMIVSNDPYIAYTSSILLSLSNYLNLVEGKNQEVNENKKLLISIASYVGCVLNVPLFERVKEIIGLPATFQLNQPKTADIAIDTVLKMIKMFLAITEVSTNGNTKSVWDYNVKAQSNLQTIISLCDYLFQNGSVVLGRKNVNGFPSEPIEMFFNALFALFNYGSGSMTPIIEKAKHIEKAFAPLLINAATNVLSPEKFDSTLGSKKLWAQTIKFMNACVSNPEIKFFAFTQFENFLIVIIEKLQFSTAALESDLLKQPVLTFAAILYEGKSKINTAKRILIINSLVRIAEIENNQKGRSVPKILHAIGNIFDGFTINPKDSHSLKTSNVSDYDKLKFASDRIAKLFAIISDIVRDEPEEENEVKNAACECFTKILDSNFETCYTSFMHYARQVDSLFGQTIRDVFTKHLQNSNSFKNVYYTDKLLKDNFAIFLHPPVVSYSFYLTALKHVVASMLSDVLFDMMTKEFAKTRNVNNEIFKCFYASWFSIAMTPKVLETMFKNINSGKSIFNDFIPDGSFPYYLKRLSKETGLSLNDIFEKLIFLPILQHPLPFGIAFPNVEKAEETAGTITEQMLQYIEVVGSVNVSYFSLPKTDLAKEIRTLHHFLDNVPVPIQDHENYTRCDDVFLQLYKSNFFVCNDIDIKRRKYWILSTKNIPKAVQTSDVIDFINQSLPNNQESIILLDAEFDPSMVLDNFDRIIFQIDRKLESVFLYRAGLGSGSKIARLSGEKFNILLDSQILPNVVLPLTIPINEIKIPAKMPDVDDLFAYLYDDRIEFSALEEGLPVFASIGLNEIQTTSVLHDALHIKTAERDIRITTPSAVSLNKIIETWKSSDSLIIMPTRDYSLNPLYEIISVAMFSVSSTEADISSKAISLFYAALGALKGKVYKSSNIQTHAGFSMPMKKFKERLGEYQNQIIPYLALNPAQSASSATSLIIAETMNDETLPSSVISAMGQEIIRVYVSNQRAQAAMKQYLLTKINNTKLVSILIPLIAKYSEQKSFADLIFCLLKCNPEAVFDSLYSTLIKNEISGMTFYQFVIKSSFYGIISNIYTKNSHLFDNREATCLFIAAIGITLSPNELLRVFKDFFIQFLKHFQMDDIVEKFNNASPDPKIYLSIVNEAAERSNEYQGYLNSLDIMAQSGYPDAIVISRTLDEMQSTNVIKCAFETSNPRRLIYALENTSDFVSEYNLMNVHPLFIIWSAFPLIQSLREDVKGAALELIHSIFVFAQNKLNYPSIFDVASSINQSDHLTNAMEQFYDALFDKFGDTDVNFEDYFGLALASSLVEPLSIPSLREKATIIINDALDSDTDPYFKVYFIILAVVFTDLSVESLIEKSGINGEKENKDAAVKKDSSDVEAFTKIVCNGAKDRTHYEAVWITKALFKGLTTRDDRCNLFAQSLIDFMKVRTEIQLQASTYILHILTPLIDAPECPKDKMRTLSKVLAVATTALPYGDDSQNIELGDPKPNKLKEDDLSDHFKEIVNGIEDSIKNAFRVE